MIQHVCKTLTDFLHAPSVYHHCLNVTTLCDKVCQWLVKSELLWMSGMSRVVYLCVMGIDLTLSTILEWFQQWQFVFLLKYLFNAKVILSQQSEYYIC
jgi:hypothetical protein